MRNKFLVFGLAIVLFACGSSQQASSGTGVTPGGPEGVKTRIDNPKIEGDQAKPVDPADFYSDALRMTALMNFLASDDLKGREAGSKGIATAASFIEADCLQYCGLDSGK